MSWSSCIQKRGYTDCWTWLVCQHPVAGFGMIGRPLSWTKKMCNWHSFARWPFCRIYMNCALPWLFFQVPVFFIGKNERFLRFVGKLSWLETSIFSNGFPPNWCFKMDSFDEKELMISWMHLSFLNLPFHQLCDGFFCAFFHWQTLADHGAWITWDIVGPETGGCASHVSEFRRFQGLSVLCIFDTLGCTRKLVKGLYP